MQSQSFQFHICAPGKLMIEQTNWVYFPPKTPRIKIIMMNNLIVRPSVHIRMARNGNVSFIGNSQHDLIMRHYLFTTDFLASERIAVTHFNTDDSLRHLVEDLK